MKNLENYGVLEMNTKELKETDGGFAGFIVAGLAATYYLEYAIGYYQNH